MVKGSHIAAGLLGIGIGTLVFMQFVKAQPPTLTCPKPPAPPVLIENKYIIPVFDQNGCIIDWSVNTFPKAPTPPYCDNGYSIPLFDVDGYLSGWECIQFPECPTCPTISPYNPPAGYYGIPIIENGSIIGWEYFEIPVCPVIPQPPDVEPGQRAKPIFENGVIVDWLIEDAECPDVCIPTDKISIGDYIIKYPWRASGLYGYAVSYPIRNNSDQSLSGLARAKSVDYDDGRLLREESKSFNIAPGESQFIDFAVGKIDGKAVPVTYTIEFVLPDGTVLARREESI